MELDQPSNLVMEFDGKPLPRPTPQIPKAPAPIPVATPVAQPVPVKRAADIIRFLEVIRQKSILNEHTVECRLTACNHLFAGLKDEENHLPFIRENLEVLVNRFKNRNRQVSASTLRVYKSRAKSSIEDFVAWAKDPLEWERSLSDKSVEIREERKAVPRDATRDPLAAKVSPGRRRVRFPIRDDFEVEMLLPAEGLTLRELHRLGLFLYPYCQDLEPKEKADLWPKGFEISD